MSVIRRQLPETLFDGVIKEFLSLLAGDDQRLKRAPAEALCLQFGAGDEEILRNEQATRPLRPPC